MSSKDAFHTAQKANRNKRSMYSQEKLRLERDMKDAYMNLSYINIMKKLIRLNELSSFLCQSRKYHCLEEPAHMEKHSLGHPSVSVGALLVRDGAFIKHYCTLLEKAGEFNKEGRKMEIYRQFHNQIDIRESMFKAYFMKDVVNNMKETSQKAGMIPKFAGKKNEMPLLSRKKSSQINYPKAHSQASPFVKMSKELSAVSSKSPLTKLPRDLPIKRDHFSTLKKPSNIQDMVGVEQVVQEIIGYYSALKYYAPKSDILNFSMKGTLGVYKQYVVRRGVVTLMQEHQEKIYQGIFVRKTSEPDDWLSKGGIEGCLRCDDTVTVIVIDE